MTRDNLEALITEVECFLNILKEREIGLSSWYIATNHRWNRVKESVERSRNVNPNQG